MTVDGDELDALFAGRSPASRRALASAWAGTTRSRAMLPLARRGVPSGLRLVQLTEHFADHRERPVWINPNRVAAVKPHVAARPGAWLYVSGTNGVIGVAENVADVVSALTGTRAPLEQDVIAAARAWRANLSDEHAAGDATRRLVDALVALDCDHPANDRVVTRDGTSRCGQCGSLAEPVSLDDDDEQP